MFQTMSRRSSSEALSKLGQRRQVVLPSSVCERLGLEVGDYVQFVVRGSEVLVQPRRLAPLERERPSAPSREKRLRLLAEMPAGGSDLSLELVRASRTVSPPPNLDDE